jgi:hypothetical protein
MSIALLMMTAAVAASPAPGSDAAAVSAFGAAARVDSGSLERATAREDLSQVAVSEQTSRVSNNTISGPSVTGPVTIDGNAFQNLQGLAIINANAGNNVSINASLTVNLNFSPAP